MSQPNPVINTYDEFCYWSTVFDKSFERLEGINAELWAIRDRPFWQRLRAWPRLRQLKKDQAWRRQYHERILTEMGRYCQKIDMV